MRRVWLGVVSAFAVGCGCPKKVATETPPSNLAGEGIVLDGPEDGARVEGRWISVSGWVDPAEVGMVAVLGAPVDGFYEAGGHVGVPTVFVVTRKDGRFLAPRVPVAPGENQVTIVAISRQGRPLSPVRRTVNASNVESIPATIVANPTRSAPGQSVVLRASTGTALERSWQWDFNGDGIFDEESSVATHIWTEPGRFHVIARTRVEETWLYAVMGITVASDARVIYSTTEVGEPSLIKVYGKGVAGTPPDFVIAIDGSAVKVFDGRLKLLRTLSGLIRPIDFDLYKEDLLVLDRDLQAVVRFHRDSGEIATQFGVGGMWKAAAPGRLANALSIEEVYGYDEEKLSFSLPSGATYNVSFELDGGILEFESDYEEGDGDCFKPPFSTPDGQIEGGKLCRHARVVERKGVQFVDYIGSPQPIIADFWLLDSLGTLHLYRTASHDSEWKLEYPIVAAGAGHDGRVFTAGKGILELRDLPPLRWQVGQ